MVLAAHHQIALGIPFVATPFGTKISFAKRQLCYFELIPRWFVGLGCFGPPKTVLAVRAFVGGMNAFEEFEFEFNSIILSSRLGLCIMHAAL
jgi:hypothetical protein